MSKSDNAATAETVEQEIFIGRQPILNSDQKLVGYELLFRGSAHAGAANIVDDVQATSRLLINTFNNFGVERALGNKTAFINISEGLLFSDVIEVLPPQKVVLEILESVKPSAEVAERCRVLKGKGYQLALDDFVYRPEYEPLIPLVAYVKLIFARSEPGDCRNRFRRCAGADRTCWRRRSKPGKSWTSVAPSSSSISRDIISLSPKP